MTCIVAVRNGASAVFMGSDSISANQHRKFASRTSKIYQCGPVTIGLTGSWRAANILANFKPPDMTRGQSPAAYMADVFAPKLAEAYRAGHFMEKKDDVEKFGEAPMFVATVRRRIFYLQNDLSVVETRDRFAAVGAGEEYAVGALKALDGIVLPRVACRLALQAAAHGSPLVMPPFDIRECR